MVDATDNNGQNSDNGNNQQNNAAVDTSSSGGAVDNIDANISKHLDMAIEAQDGKPANANTQTEGEKETEGEADKTKQSGDSKGGTGDGATQQQPSKEASEAGKTLARAKDLRLQDGTIVKGGAERRFFEQREIARQELNSEKTAHQQTLQKFERATQEIASLKNATQTLHGVEPQVVAVGVKVVQDLQRDPVGTLKKLLAETAAQGYNVEDLGVGIDTQAIKRLLDERLPNNANRQPTDEEIINDATNEVAQFYGRFPDAQPHDALIARVLRDHPNETLQSVYFTLKSQFADHGFDWSKSLEANLQEAQASDPQNKGGTPTDQKLPLPSGGNGEGDFKLNGGGPAHEDMDTGDIVKQAMRESGLNI